MHAPSQSKGLTFGVPIMAWVLFGLHFSIHHPLFSLLLFVALVLSVLQAVHHAEIIAQAIGEPFGTLVLALAVTCIEASLIISLMIAGGPDAAALARDTVFAAVMIILTGMLGLSIFIGSLRFSEQNFIQEGANATITTLVAISVLTLILPNFTTSVPGPYYSDAQLIFVAIITLALYASFLFVQNFKHKEYFVEEKEPTSLPVDVTKKDFYTSLVLLVICLAAVVLLAKSLAPDLDLFVEKIGAPHSLAGVIIAMIVLMPEALSAFSASRKNQLQKSLNLSLGSALASICLTLPVVSGYALITKTPLVLGIDNASSVLFLLSLFVVVLSLKTGKTSILSGIILLLIFLVYLFITIFP
jgi:Ca2+:H+ antiporter